MPNIYVNNGSNVPVKEVHANVAGVWTRVNQVWVNNAGTWQMAFPESTGSQAITSPGTTSFTVPNGVYSVLVSVYGAGGQGSSLSFCGDAWHGGGGGSGGYLQNQTVAVTPGTVLTITCGAGGAGGYYPGNCAGHTNGGAGGASSVTGGIPSVSAGGGGGGVVGGCYPCPGSGGAAGSPSGAAGGSGSGGGPGGGGVNATGIGNGGGGDSAGGANGRVNISW